MAYAPDTAGAVFANPATLAQLPEETLRSASFSATFFQPDFHGHAAGLTAESDKIYSIPTLAVGGTLGDSGSGFRWGFASYVVSGLGGDYRGSALAANLAPTPFPLVATTRAELQVIELAPSVSWRISDELSAGLALRLDQGSFNLGSGEENGFAAGLTPGLVWRPARRVSFGLAYVSPAVTTYDRLFDFDGNGSLDSLKLESPHQVRIGASYELVPDRLRLAADARWFNWSGSQGYGDFGWRDTWLLGAAAEYSAIPGKLTVRTAYNHGSSPVRGRPFNGVGLPGNTVNVQGKSIPAYYYEAFRVISFPAIAKDHVSVGLAWNLTDRWTANLGLTHSFKTTLSESGVDLLGNPTSFSTSLEENSVELGFSWSC